MTLAVLIILILIGLVAGMFSRTIGIGGAIVIIPSLIFPLGKHQYEAQGSSLAGILPLIGGYFGFKLTLNISQNNLRNVLAVILVLIALKLFLSK